MADDAWDYYLKYADEQQLASGGGTVYRVPAGEPVAHAECWTRRGAWERSAALFAIEIGKTTDYEFTQITRDHALSVYARRVAAGTLPALPDDL